MSAPFYVWDARTHGGFPADLDQAEYMAIHEPRESDISPAVEAWIQALQSFVLSDENKPYMADNVIWGVKELHARTVLEIEQIHIEGGDYFYKFLLESLREHQLAAYDSYRGIFICHEYYLPNYLEQQFSQEFASIIHPKDEVLDLTHLPRSEKQFKKLVYDWVSQQDFIGGKFEIKDIPWREGGETWSRLVRHNKHFSEICVLSLIYRGGLKVDRFYHEIKVHALEGVMDFNDFQIYPRSIKFKQQPICTYGRYIDTTQQLHDFLFQLKGYFDLIDPHLQSLTTLNHCMNHDDDFNFKDDYFSFENKPGKAPFLLALAKLCNDPLYEQLFEQWKNNIITHKGDEFWQCVIPEDSFLFQLEAIENI